MAEDGSAGFDQESSRSTQPKGWRKFVPSFGRRPQAAPEAVQTPENTELPPQLFHINQEATSKYKSESLNTAERKGLVGEDEVVVSFDGDLDSFVKWVSGCQTKPLRNVNTKPLDVSNVPLGMFGFKELRRTGIELIQPLYVPKNAQTLTPQSLEGSHQRVEIVGLSEKSGDSCSAAIMLPNEFRMWVPQPRDAEPDGLYGQHRQKMSNLSTEQIKGDRDYLDYALENPMISSGIKEQATRALEAGAHAYLSTPQAPEMGYYTGRNDEVLHFAERVVTPDQAIKGDYLNGGNVLRQRLEEGNFKSSVSEIVVPATMAAGLTAK